MGLESINFFFKSEEQLTKETLQQIGVEHVQDNKYVFKKEQKYWIDIELQDQQTLSIRITLCNPFGNLFGGMDKLLESLFNYEKPILVDMSTKNKYTTYDLQTKELLSNSYLKKREPFKAMYGDNTAAIGSEEFYKSR